MSNIPIQIKQPTLVTYLFDGGNMAPHDLLRPRLYTIMSMLENKPATYPARLLNKINPANDNTTSPNLPTLIYNN